MTGQPPSGWLRGEQGWLSGEQGRLAGEQQRRLSGEQQRRLSGEQRRRPSGEQQSWLSDEQQRAWRGYLTMVGRLQAEMNRQLRRDSGLSLSDYDVLVALSEQGPLRMFELTEVLAWEQSRLSHQLRRMSSRGLVARHGGDDDRRGVIVGLTDAGRAALAAAAPGHVELVRRIFFDGLSTAQLRALRSLTETVLRRC